LFLLLYHISYLFSSGLTIKTQVLSLDITQQENIRQEIAKLQRRVQELENVIAKLYEDKVSGTISEAAFQLLLEKSEQERNPEI